MHRVAECNVDVRDVDRVSCALGIDVADVEIDVAHIDFGNNGPAIDVRHVDHTLPGPVIEVGDVDHGVELRVHGVAERNVDVRDVDRVSLALGIDVADVEIDVAHIDFGNNGPAIDVRYVDHTLPGPDIDVRDVDDRLEWPVYRVAERNVDVRDVDHTLLGPDADIADVEISLNRADNGLMQRENDAPDVEVVTDAASDATLAIRDEPLPPVVPDRATLIRGFRLLAERIPGFIHLTPDETRRMIRASALDEDMIAAALVAADVWERAQAKIWLKMTPEELRELDATIRESDDVIRELRILLKGMEDANRVRKHRRGKAILSLYKGLEISVDSYEGRYNYMRPYFENMQRAYMKNRKRSKEKGGVTSPPSPGTAGGSGD